MTITSAATIKNIREYVKNASDLAAMDHYGTIEAAAPLGMLWACAHVEEAARQRTLDSMRVCRMAGFSNGEIADVLGVTRQAVQMRLDGRPRDRKQAGLQEETLPFEAPERGATPTQRV